MGTWEIKDGRFYLVALGGEFELTPGEPLFADWVTGVVCIPRGEVLGRFHAGFGGMWEEEVHVKIERGVVVASWSVDNRDR